MPHFRVGGLQTLTGLLLAAGSLTAQTATITRPEAAALIAKSAEFQGAVTRTFGLHRLRCIPRDYNIDGPENARYKAVAAWLQERGLITTTFRPAKNECGFLLSSNSDVLAISVTEAGQAAAATWPRRPIGDMDSQMAMEIGGQRGPDWNVPIEGRRFVQIAGVASMVPATGQIPVQFVWDFADLSGDRFQRESGTAFVRKYDTGWRVEKIDGLAVRSALRPSAFSYVLPPASPAATAKAPSAASAPTTPTAPAPPTATAPVPPPPDKRPRPAISGAWSGEGMDSSGPGQMDWELTEKDGQVTGRARAKDAATGATFTAKLTGELTGPVLNFTLAVAPGELPRPNQNCEIVLKGKANATASEIRGTYAGTACGRPVSNGQFTLLRK